MLCMRKIPLWEYTIVGPFERLEVQKIILGRTPGKVFTMNIKKLVALILVVVISVAACYTAFAAQQAIGTISVPVNKDSLYRVDPDNKVSSVRSKAVTKQTSVARYAKDGFVTGNCAKQNLLSLGFESSEVAVYTVSILNINLVPEEARQLDAASLAVYMMALVTRIEKNATTLNCEKYDSRVHQPVVKIQVGTKDSEYWIVFLRTDGIWTLCLKGNKGNTVVQPTATPTSVPTATPTAVPTATPTAEPTATPTAEPTATPTAEPTATPTAEPTATPTAEPTATPTAEPTATPTAEPTATPTAEPTATPTPEPTATPEDVDPTPVWEEDPTPTPTPEESEEPWDPDFNWTPEPTSEPTPAPTQDVDPTPIWEDDPTPAPEPDGRNRASRFGDKYTVSDIRRTASGRCRSSARSESSGRPDSGRTGFRPCQKRFARP